MAWKSLLWILDLVMVAKHLSFEKMEKNLVSLGYQGSQGMQGCSWAREFRRHRDRANSHSGPRPACQSSKEKQTQADGSGSGTKPPPKTLEWPCLALAPLRAAAGGHSGWQLRPRAEVPPGDRSSSTHQAHPVPGCTGTQAKPERRCARCGLYSRSRPSSETAAPPAALASLSAFEFQSKPEMDGVIKSPKRGAKRLLWKNCQGTHAVLHLPGPCWLLAPAWLLLFTHPSPTRSQGSDQPQGPQTAFCDVLSQTLHLPTLLATTLLCFLGSWGAASPWPFQVCLPHMCWQSWQLFYTSDLLD